MADRVAFVEANPLADPPALRAVNSLGKIPVLIRDDGRALFDSPVICEYLDSLGLEPRLIPADAAARIEVLMRQALADGIMDAAFSLVMERRRPEAQQSPEWIERWSGAILRGVRALPVAPPASDIDLGDLTAACALGYLDFRLPDLDWRAGGTELAGWYAEITARPSIARTAPPTS